MSLSNATRLQIDAPARIAALTACLETIGEFGEARNLDHNALARVSIIVEELFLNTIGHGYAGECDRPVRLSLEAGATLTLTLTYEDDAPPFDPIAWAAQEDRPPRTASSREGGAGLDLLFGLAAVVDYQRRETGNRLVVTVGSD